MRAHYLAASSLLPLAGRDCLDFRVYLLLVTLADSTGRVGTRTSPMSLERIAAYLVAPGGHGKAGSSPTRYQVLRALRRLEGVPGRAGWPRYLTVVQTIERRGSIFQVEMGRGEVRLFPAAAQPAAQTNRPESRAKAQSSRAVHTPAAQPAAQSVDTVFLSKNARGDAVDKPAGREAMRRIRELLADARGASS
jgi:hypothetical protein